MTTNILSRSTPHIWRPAFKQRGLVPCSSKCLATNIPGKDQGRTIIIMDCSQFVSSFSSVVSRSCRPFSSVLYDDTEVGPPTFFHGEPWKLSLTPFFPRLMPTNPWMLTLSPFFLWPLPAKSSWRLLTLYVLHAIHLLTSPVVDFDKTCNRRRSSRPPPLCCCTKPICSAHRNHTEIVVQSNSENRHEPREGQTTRAVTLTTGEETI